MLRASRMSPSLVGSRPGIAGWTRAPAPFLQKYSCRGTSCPHARCIIAASSSTADARASTSKEDSPTTSGKSWWKEWWAVVPEQDNSGFVSPKAIFKELLLLSSANTSWLVVGFFSLLAGAACDLAIPHFISRSFEAVIAACATPASLPITALATVLSWKNIMLALALSPELIVVLVSLMAVSAGQAIFYAIRGTSFSVINYRVVRDLRAKLFKRLISQDVLFFDKEGNDSAALSSRLSGDCLAISRLITNNLNIALRNGLQAVGGLIYLFLMNKALALGCLFTAAVMCYISIKNGIFQRKAMSALQKAVAETTSVAEESLNSMRLVRAHGYEGHEQKRYFKKTQRVVDIGIRSTAAYGIYMLTHVSTWHIASIFILAVGGAHALAGVITAGQLTAFILYSDHVLQACLAVCEQIASIMENIGSADTVLKMIQLPESKQVSTGIKPVPESWEKGISIKDLMFTYPGRIAEPAVRSLDLKLEPGSTTALVGKSGSGKSTLVQLLTRQVDPDSGSIFLADTDLQDIDSEWFRSFIAIVPQEPRLFTTTVFENIAYGAEAATLEDVERAARAANAHGFISELPEGYHTAVSDGSLSGGQRQRIGIARALIRNPKLLVLDEATSALDASSEAAVQSAIEQIMADRSRTVVIVAHRLSTVRACDNIVVMDAGAIAESGTHEELMGQEVGIYRGLVLQQLNGKREQATQVDLAPHEGDDPVISNGKCNGAKVKAGKASKSSPDGDEVPCDAEAHSTYT